MFYWTMLLLHEHFQCVILQLHFVIVLLDSHKSMLNRILERSLDYSERFTILFTMEKKNKEIYFDKRCLCVLTHFPSIPLNLFTISFSMFNQTATGAALSWSNPDYAHMSNK